MHLILAFLFDEIKLVRVQYDAVTHNAGSITAATRFGFREEGVCRNLGGMVPGRKRVVGEGDKASQDLWVSSMTDYEWEVEGRGRLEGMCGRAVVDTRGL